MILPVVNMANPKKKTNSNSEQEKKTSDLPVGSLVVFYSNGYRYATLININRKWATVLYAGKKKKVLAEEIKLCSL